MDISIAGRHTLLFDDDTNATFVNSSEALVPWSNDSSLLIDRYDVRHLLDRMPPRPKRTRIIEDTAGVPKSQLDHERFLKLPDDHDADGVSDDEHELLAEPTQMSEEKGSGGYQAVPFSYGNSDISAVPNDSESEQNGSTFCPPFPVPDNLLSNLPSTEKQHQIIARTAKFVSEHGGQSEIVLRVKQGDNPTFGFLMPGNHLHAYFRYLVDHPQLLKAGNTQENKKSDGQENEAVATGGGALSLLGSVYGFGDDDDNAPQTDSTKPIDPIASNTSDISASPINANKGDTCTNVALEGKKESMKDRVTAAILEKAKRNQSVNAAFLSKKDDSIISLQGEYKGQSHQAEKTDVKQLILEPPSFMKQTMDKIVEFILRNGKQFEAVLIEQDKAAGRFPFLLPSNQYNPYYVKLLQEAYETKLLGKNPPERSKRSREESPSDLSVTERSETSTDPNKKEKFKMVIGGPKKDSSDPPPKPTRIGVTADEAAAIVLAATRGRNPANFQSASRDTGRSSLQHQKMPGDVSAATAIAKSVALAASNEADSSEAPLTKEQKVKAERLKRAKMFAAMVKSGTKPTPELVKSTTIPIANVESSAAEEREGSCAPVDAGPSHKDRKYRKSRHSRSKDHDEDSEEGNDHKHSRRKKHVDDYDRHHHRHRHKHHNDSSEDSEDEHRHEKRSRHRHRKHDDSSEDDRDRSHKKRSKHRSRSERDRDEDFGMSEIALGSNSESAILDAKPIDNTEIPNDLRAKIRAMLMETL